MAETYLSLLDGGVLQMALLNLSLADLEEACKEQNVQKICNDDKFWKAKLEKDFGPGPNGQECPKAEIKKSAKATYYRKNLEDEFNQQVNFVARYKSGNPEVQALLDTKKKLEAELRDVDDDLQEERTRLENRAEKSNRILQSFYHPNPGRLFNIMLDRKISEDILVPSDDTSETYFTQLIRDNANIDWENLDSEDIYIFWIWYKDGPKISKWRSFIGYLSNEGFFIINRLYRDELPLFLREKFGEDKQKINNFLAPYGLNIKMLAEDFS